MKFWFHPVADKEFDQAVQYYEECQLGLDLGLRVKYIPQSTE